MKRRFVSVSAFATVIAAALWGVWLKAEPETVDARSCIPGNAWVYVEFGPGSTEDWKEYFFGGLPEKERADAEKKLQEIWDDFARMASEQAGTDVAAFLKEIDRVHFALLDFDLVTVERSFGPGQTWETDRPEVEIALIVKSKTKGYFGKLLENDMKDKLQPGPEYRTRKTWVAVTQAKELDRDFKTVDTVHVAAVGDTVFVSNLRAGLEKMLDAVDGVQVPGGPLTANPDFQRAQKLAGKDAMLLGFVNLREMFKGIEEAMDRDDLETYQQIDAVAGQSSLRSGVFYSGLDGRYSYSGATVFLDADNELWQILRQEPAKKDLLKAVPASATGCGLLTLREPATLWAKMRKFILAKQHQLAPEMEERGRGFENELTEFENQLGTSIDDILNVIDDEIGWAGVVVGEEGRFDEKAQVIYVELKDVEKAKVVLDSIKESSFFQEAFRGAQIATSEHQSYTIYSTEGGEVPIAYAIADKVFILTFDVATLKAVLDAIKTGKVLDGDKQYKDAMKRLPAENSKLFYYNAGQVMRLVAREELDSEMAEKLKGDQGMAFVTVEKAEEASLIAGCELNSDYYASLVMNAIPMLEEQRNQAIDANCTGNLRMIGTATAMWVDQFGDSREYPMTLEDLTGKQLLAPRGSKCPVPDAKSPGYGYLYPPKGFGTGMDFILAFDNAPHKNGKRGVLYFSGRAEMLEEATFVTALEAQYETLATEIEDAQKEVAASLEEAEGDRKAALEKKQTFLEGYLKDVKAKIKK